MSLKKISIIAAALVLLAIVVFFGVRFFTKDATPPDTLPGNPFGGIGGSNVTPGTPDRITIRDAEGRAVSTTDFLVGRTPVEFAGDTYYDLLEGTAFANGNASFELQYAEYSSLFSIVLVGEPLGEARRAAEQFLRDALGLTNEEICRLNITVVVDGDVNALYAEYEDLGLTFCATPVPLP